MDKIILKIKSTFDGPTGYLVVKSIRDKRKDVFTEPETETSIRTDADATVSVYITSSQ